MITSVSAQILDDIINNYSGGAVRLWERPRRSDFIFTTQRAGFFSDFPMGTNREMNGRVVALGEAIKKKFLRVWSARTTLNVRDFGLSEFAPKAVSSCARWGDCKGRKKGAGGRWEGSGVGCCKASWR